MLKDYYEMICLPQWKWIKKHWKGYLVFPIGFATRDWNGIGCLLDWSQFRESS